METKPIKKIVEIDENIYVSSDGNEFKRPTLCTEYGERAGMRKYSEMVEKLNIPELDGFIPLNADGYGCDKCSFYWYEVDTEEDLNILKIVYHDASLGSGTYPELICIEIDSDGCFEDNVYGHTQTEIMDTTKEFWEKLGYDVEFKKKVRVKNGN